MGVYTPTSLLSLSSKLQTQDQLSVR